MKIITRHPALIEYLMEIGLADRGAQILSHATEKDVAGEDIIGVLPLALAAKAKSITEVPLALTPEMRGKELDLDTIRAIAGKPQTYKVSAI